MVDRRLPMPSRSASRAAPKTGRSTKKSAKKRATRAPDVHRPETIDAASRVLHLSGGQLTEAGREPELSET